MSQEKTRAEVIKTRAEVINDFKRTGKTVRQWAKKHNVSVRAVYSLLSGKTKGDRGESHKVAVLLGIKSGVIEDAE